MAERPSVKDILAAVRKGGPAKPADEVSGPGEPAAEAAASAAESGLAPAATPAPPANIPTPSSLGRPLTLKEKLAAARAGGAVQPGGTTPAAPVAKPAQATEEAPAPAPVAPAPTAAELGRPLTLKEKLAAARSGAAAAPATGGAKPAAKAAPSSPAAKAAEARVLPPLDKLSDPKDLAEAARQAGAKAKAASAPADTGKAKPAKKEALVVPPRPSKGAADVTTTAGTEPGMVSRRRFVRTVSVGTWVVLGWATFTAGMAALLAACGRFMFPNVLAEPPSTIKVGVPANFEPEEVNERWKAEWGFWIVRSTKYNGQDVIYAIQSVCTHLGCPPNWLGGEQKFKCPCHGSGFYISGVNFEGPAPRPLERFKVSLADDGQILVDKSQKYQEEMGQWADPDSFVPV